jgi:hypothetical protein
MRLIRVVIPRNVEPLQASQGMSKKNLARSDAARAIVVFCP